MITNKIVTIIKILKVILKMSILAPIVTVFGSLMASVNFIQAYKIYKRKHSSDVSLIAFGMFFIGSLVWIAYGLEIMDWPILISNSIGFFSTGSVVILWFKYRNKGDKI
jgi:MtN3 and saliva related transmembrane protein